MGFKTNSLFETHGDICGCPGFWGIVKNEPNGEQLLAYSPHHRIQAQDTHACMEMPSSPPILPLDSTIPSPCDLASVYPVAPEPKKDWTCFWWYHGNCRKGDQCDRPHEPPSSPVPLPPGYSNHRHSCNLPFCPLSSSPAVPSKAPLRSSSPPSPPPTLSYDLVSHFPTPPGPPKETCFFWYHGECRRGDQCDRPHETQITWPVSPPKGYVHFRSCNLPLCPMKDGFQDLIKGCGGKAGRAFDANMIYGDSDVLGFGIVDLANENESSFNAAQDDDSGKKTSDSDSGSEHEASSEHGRTVAGEIDFISLSSSRCSSIASSSSSSNSSLTLSPTPVSGTAPKGSRATSISHLGTYRPRLQSQPNPNSSVRKTATHFLPTKPVTSPAAKPVGASAQCLDLPPKTNPFDKVCFFWYHQGYCRPRRGIRCLFLHTLATATTTEVNLPELKRGHDQNCPLPLCPARPQRVRFETTKGNSLSNTVAGRTFKPAPDSEYLAKRMAGPQQPGKRKASQLETHTSVPEPKRVRFEQPVANQVKGNSLPHTVAGRTRTPAPGSRYLAKRMADSQSMPAPRVLAEYNLPSRDDRLAWDTDFVRRTFGEIE